LGDSFFLGKKQATLSREFKHQDHQSINQSINVIGKRPVTKGQLLYAIYTWYVRVVTLYIGKMQGLGRVE
jgi:hypothetical protein